MSHRNTPLPVIMSSVSLGTIISAVGPKPIKEVPLGPLLCNSFLKKSITKLENKDLRIMQVYF